MAPVAPLPPRRAVARSSSFPIAQYLVPEAAQTANLVRQAGVTAAMAALPLLEQQLPVVPLSRMQQGELAGRPAERAKRPATEEPQR